MKNQTTQITSLPEPTDAHILRGLLETSGINASLFGEYGDPFIEVYVPIEQKEEALKVVEKFYANYSEKSKDPQNSSPQKSCFSPHKKYVISALLFPIFAISLFLYMGQFDNIKHLFPFIIFSVLFIAPILMILPNLTACPKCEQKIGCGLENCLDWFGLNKLSGIFNKHCKKCGHDLSRCDKGED